MVYCASAIARGAFIWVTFIGFNCIGQLFQELLFQFIGREMKLECNAALYY